MDIKIILYFLSVASATLHSPKVHEDQMEYYNTRVVRNPNDHGPLKLHKPPVFNFQSATQQDHRKNRYALQQQADMINLPIEKTKIAIHTTTDDEEATIIMRGWKNDKAGNAKSRKVVKLNSGEIFTNPTSSSDDWQPMNPAIKMKSESIENQKEIAENNMELMKINAPKEKIPLKLNDNKEPKSRSNKKLKQNSFYQNEDDLQSESTQTIKSMINREDHVSSESQSQYIYVQPNILKNNFGIEAKDAQRILKNASPDLNKNERNLAVLSDLIGKNPNVQLEGLKKLLEAPHANNILPVIQGPQPFKPNNHPPIHEGSVDIENEQHEIPGLNQLKHSNSKPILEALQAQLDASSKEQANNVLAHAHQQALAHVEAQHKAIALAAEHAKQEAFAKIAAQNDAYKPPQALALTAPAPQNHKHTPAPQAFIATTRAPLAHFVYAVPTSQSPIHVNHPTQQMYQVPARIQQSYNVHQVAPTQQSYHPSISTQHEVHHQSLASPTSAQTDHHSSQSQHSIVPAPPSYSKTVALKPNVQLYAPNHHHQIIALLQAERVVASQVKQQNDAIIHAQAQKEAARHNALLQHQQQEAEQQNHVEVQVHQSVPQVVVHRKPYHDVALENGAENKIYSGYEDDSNELLYAAKYAFGYRIKDNKMGNDFGHEEKRDGKTATGQYHVLLPDGRLQNVEYYADDSGYHAKVSYQNLAHH